MWSHVKYSEANDVVCVRESLSARGCRIVDSHAVTVRKPAGEEHEVSSVVDVGNHDSAFSDVVTDCLEREILRLVHAIIWPDNFHWVDGLYGLLIHRIGRDDVSSDLLQPSVECCRVGSQSLWSNKDTASSEGHCC